MILGAPAEKGPQSPGANQVLMRKDEGEIEIKSIFYEREDDGGVKDFGLGMDGICHYVCLKTTF